MTIADIGAAEQGVALDADLSPHPEGRPHGFRHSGFQKHRCKDGRLIDVEIASSDIDIDGRHGRLVLATDVTERLAAERALREGEQRLRSTLAALADSEARFRALFFSAPEAISLSDLDSGRFLQVNSAFSELFGFSAEQVIGRTAIELALWTQAEGRQRIIARLRAGEAVHGFEGLARRRSGETIDVSFSADIVQLQGGDCLLLMFRDVTARRRAEEALRRSEQRFRLAAAAGHVWEWDFGAGGVTPPLEFFNALGHTDVTPETAVAAFTTIVHADDLVEIRRCLTQHLRRQGAYRVQFRARDAHGRERWFETQGQAVWNEQGRATYMAGTTFEITERRMAEQELMESQRELFELSQRLLYQERDTNQRLAQSLHDRLGQNLGSARLFLDLVRGQVDEGAVATMRPLERLAQLLDLAIGEVRSTLVALRPPLLESQGLVTALHTELADYGVSGLTTKVELDVAPSARTQRWPEAVEYAAFMVAREAVANAMRHARASKVCVHLAGSPGRVALTVSDDGMGIAAVDLHGPPGHLGIVGMRERALGIGGRVTVERRGDRGTEVQMTWSEATP